VWSQLKSETATLLLLDFFYQGGLEFASAQGNEACAPDSMSRPGLCISHAKFQNPQVSDGWLTCFAAAQSYKSSVEACDFVTICDLMISLVRSKGSKPLYVLIAVECKAYQGCGPLGTLFSRSSRDRMLARAELVCQPLPLLPNSAQLSQLLHSVKFEILKPKEQGWCTFEVIEEPLPVLLLAK
jgi:hypothetical protein